MKSAISILSLVVILLALSACEHKVYMETTVHEDGSLDKTIMLETGDTTKNFVGIGPGSGWTMTTRSIDDTTHENKDDKKWNTTYQKKFVSAEEVNAELAKPSDTLFRVSSKFDKKFRWFYTYLYFSDTYHSINRMTLPPDDFIAQEDYAFIERLPAEGTTISKADSLYLTELHKKIFDIYGVRAIYEAHYSLNEKLIRESGLEDRWLDTLKKHKENIYQRLVKNENVPEDFMYKSMDSLGIPFPMEKMRSRYDELYKLEDAKTNFINHASEGQYTHKINMPWNVLQTNADSVSGNQLLWSPPSIKFLLKDYTMYAEARKVNYWAFGVSLLVLGFTGYLFARKSR